MLKKPTHSFDDYSPEHYSVSRSILYISLKYSPDSQSILIIIQKPKIHNLKCQKKKKKALPNAPLVKIEPRPIQTKLYQVGI